MKIAITADLHLTTQERNPERYQVLQRILEQCGPLEADLLVIAGDLFDASRQNFADFEQAYLEARPADLQTIVIPGNHDPDLRGEALLADGLAVINEAHLLPLGDQPPLLLLPYQQGRTMGEAIAQQEQELEPDRWLLVGHGDWAPGLRQPNPYEPGVYMPLTRQDVDTYRPGRIFLGHIHRPYQDERVAYPGSPCPLDINETGLRRILLFDTEANDLRSELVDSPRLYFNETIVMLPVEDEAEYMRRELAERIEAWQLPSEWKDRVQLRLKVTGYTRDKASLSQVLQQELTEFELYDETGPDLSELSHTSDSDRDHIARDVRRWIQELDWKSGPAEPSEDEIVTEALKVIYGGS